MSYIITAQDSAEIDLAPDTREKEILQNVAMILSTPEFSVPMDRGLGLRQRFLDRPPAAARTLLVAEILDKMELYEPRAEVLKVDCRMGDQPGVLIPTVEVNIKDE